MDYVIKDYVLLQKQLLDLQQFIYYQIFLMIMTMIKHGLIFQLDK